MKTNFFALLTLMCALTFSSCSKDDGDTIDLQTPSEIVLNSKQTAEIKAISQSPISYKSKNEFNATVSDKGLVTANFVGETEILLTNGSNSKSIVVRVDPKINLYPEPSIEWGITKSQIIAKYGKPDTETADGIGYSGYSSAAPIAMFLFENNRLKSSAVTVKASYASTLGSFLAERYLPIDVDTSKYTAMFVNGLKPETITTAINLSVYNLSYLMVLYVDVKKISSRSDNNSADTTIDSFRTLANQLVD